MFGLLAELPPVVAATLWLLLPIGAPIIYWIYSERRAKANPNADISAGVDELRRFRRALADKPKPKSPPVDESKSE